MGSLAPQGLLRYGSPMGSLVPLGLLRYGR